MFYVSFLNRSNTPYTKYFCTPYKQWRSQDYCKVWAKKFATHL